VVRGLSRVIFLLAFLPTRAVLATDVASAYLHTKTYFCFVFNF